MYVRVHTCVCAYCKYSITLVLSVQFMVLSFTNKKMMLFDDEKDMDNTGPFTQYEFRCVRVWVVEYN